MKNCSQCGRSIEYRKKWENNWDDIKYCSDRCRKNKTDSSTFENAILKLLNERGAGKTICPSEVLKTENKQNKEIMEQVRQAARKLVVKGQILILQKGQVVDPSTAKGPIRLKLV